MSVAAIVVTFNRKELLLECLKGLENQTYQISKVFIIDNNSSDGTLDFLKESNLLTNPLFEYHNTNANLGGAGGFHFGVNLAMKETFEWLWLMDDDVEPKIDCLDILVEDASLNNSSCIHPQKVFLNNQSYKWDGYFNPKTLRTQWYIPERFNNQKSVLEVNYGCFEGMLIKQDIVRKVGLPDKRYFIHTDDLIYGYLASLHTKVTYTNRAQFIKKINKEHYNKFLGKEFLYLSGFNQYFNLRNHFLLRDTLLNYKKTNPVISMILIYLKFIKLFFMQLLIHRNIKDTKMIIWGFFDGIKRNYDGHKKFLSN